MMWLHDADDVIVYCALADCICVPHAGHTGQAAYMHVRW